MGINYPVKELSMENNLPNIQNTFTRAALYALCSKSPILKHIKIDKASNSELRELVNMHNAVQIQHLPILGFKYISKCLCIYATEKKPSLLKWINPEGIRIRVEDDELSSLNLNSSRPPHISLVVLKNITTSALGISLDNLENFFNKINKSENENPEYLKNNKTINNHTDARTETVTDDCGVRVVEKPISNPVKLNLPIRDTETVNPTLVETPKLYSSNSMSSNFEKLNSSKQVTTAVLPKKSSVVVVVTTSNQSSLKRKKDTIIHNVDGDYDTNNKFQKTTPTTSTTKYNTNVPTRIDLFLEDSLKFNSDNTRYENNDRENDANSECLNVNVENVQDMCIISQVSNHSGNSIAPSNSVSQCEDKFINGNIYNNNDDYENDNPDDKPLVHSVVARDNYSDGVVTDKIKNNYYDDDDDDYVYNNGSDRVKINNSPNNTITSLLSETSFGSSASGLSSVSPNKSNNSVVVKPIQKILPMTLKKNTNHKEFLTISEDFLDRVSVKEKV